MRGAFAGRRGVLQRAAAPLQLEEPPADTLVRNTEVGPSASCVLTQNVASPTPATFSAPSRPSTSTFRPPPKAGRPPPHSSHRVIQCDLVIKLWCAAR